ncbi:MAG TPA: sulfite exporter TauE/SafE family protein [bacterium]
MAGGFLRGISGFGAALGMVPLLAMVVPTQSAVVTVVLTTLLTNIPMSYATRHEADWRTVAWISVGAAVGLLPGLWLLAHLPSNDLRRMVGVVVLASAALLAFAQPRKDALTAPFRLAAGVVSGVLNGAVSLGGPPVVLYFLWTTATAETSRASFVAYFTVLQLAQLAALLVAGLITLDNLAWTAVVAPAMMLGTYAGSWVFRIGGHRHFRLIALVLLAITGLVTVIR